MNTNEAGMGSPLEAHWTNFWAAYILLYQRVSKAFPISDSKLTDQGRQNQEDFEQPAENQTKNIKMFIHLCVLFNR